MQLITLRPTVWPMAEAQVQREKQRLPQFARVQFRPDELDEMIGSINRVAGAVAIGVWEQPRCQPRLTEQIVDGRVLEDRENPFRSAGRRPDDFFESERLVDRAESFFVRAIDCHESRLIQGTNDGGGFFLF